MDSDDVTRPTPAPPLIQTLTPEQHTLVRQLGRLPGEGLSPLQHLINTYEALPLVDALFYADQVVALHTHVLVPALVAAARRGGTK